MRLFLDAHVSARRIAVALREAGHDVRSADEERALDGWEDERLLELATTEQRVMVTFNVKDFAGIAQRWAESGKHHAGCVLLVSLDHSQFGAIIRALSRALELRPDQQDWRDRVVFVSGSRAP